MTDETDYDFFKDVKGVTKKKKKKKYSKYDIPVSEEDQDYQDEMERRREAREKHGMDWQDGGVVKKKSYFGKLKKACKKKK